MPAVLRAQMQLTAQVYREFRAGGGAERMQHEMQQSAAKAAGQVAAQAASQAAQQHINEISRRHAGAAV